MKLLFIISLLLSGSFSADNVFVRDKVKVNFDKTFPNANDVVWVKQDNDNVKAVLVQDDIKTHITYNPDGTVNQCLRYYACKHLPAHIRARVYEKFPDSEIIGVTEAFSENALNYYINIKSNAKIYELRSDPTGDIVKLKSFKDGSIGAE